MQLDTPGGRRAWPLLGVLAASLLFRAPALLHARETNSDAAVVGLQAMHFLRGEWSWFLWGSGYQTSVDSAVAAVFFALLGPTPLALLFSSLALHLVLTALAWNTLARRLDPGRAALCVLPLVFTSCPSQTYILYPPRQAALTLAVAALWLLDRAADSKRSSLFAASGAILGLACFADPYALVLVPPIAIFGCACALERGALSASAGRLGGLAAGGLAGALPARLLRMHAHATHGQLDLSAGVLARNFHLLVDPCLPWALGARAYGTPGPAMGYTAWDGPSLVRSFELAGGALFLLALLAGGALLFARSIPWPVRRLALAGALAIPVTVAGFLVSPMVMDLFSARYLAAIPLLAPFALAPVASKLGLRPFALLVAPIVATTGLAGWIGYGPFLLPANPNEEAHLERVLAEQGIHAAIADYWVSYRLTFLTREGLRVVPTNPAEDRYRPYREEYENTGRVAYIYDPLRSRESASWFAEREAAGQPLLVGPLQIIHAGRFKAVIGTHPPAAR
ncbi:MAG TPA: glycosyltransferase family 39 protein [Polyangiaceae bacterium]|jgi:hypothetical protein